MYQIPIPPEHIGAVQSAPDGSNPFVNPPHPGSAVSTSDCNPADAPSP